MILDPVLSPAQTGLLLSHVLLLQKLIYTGKLACGQKGFGMLADLLGRKTQFTQKTLFLSFILIGNDASAGMLISDANFHATLQNRIFYNIICQI